MNITIAIFQFSQIQLTEIIRGNIELANYSKPTPVQVHERLHVYVYFCVYMCVGIWDGTASSLLVFNWCKM